MIAEATKERTPSYHFTYKAGDTEGEKKVGELKAKVSAAHKAGGSHQRVVVRGRLGKNSPHAQHYKDMAKQKGGNANMHPYFNIKPEHASHFDVYTRDRND